MAQIEEQYAVALKAVKKCINVIDAIDPYRNSLLDDIARLSDWPINTRKTKWKDSYQKSSLIVLDKYEEKVNEAAAALTAARQEIKVLNSLISAKQLQIKSHEFLRKQRLEKNSAAAFGVDADLKELEQDFQNGNYVKRINEARDFFNFK